jgi:hypothetical protein
MAKSTNLGPSPIFDTEVAAEQEVAPVQMGLEFPEYEQEAGLFGKFFQKGAQALEPTLTVKQALKPLTDKGVRIKQEPKIIPDPPPIAPAPVVVQPKTAKTAAKVDLAPVPLDETQRLVQERKAMQEAGPAATTPETPISNLAFDNDGLQATVRVMAESAVKNEPTMSIRSIKMRMLNAGVPENIASRMLEGLPIESTIGSSELAKTVAGVVDLHDNSAKLLDNLMERMANGQLDQAGQLELRQQMAFHNVITAQLKGVQVDVARSMNVFKRVKDAGPGFRPVDIRAILDEVGGEKSLQQIANDYITLTSRKGKNQLIEVGLGKRLRDIWINTWQSNLLTDTAPHAFSLVEGIINTARAPIERMVAIPVAKIRQEAAGGFNLMNSPAAPSEYAGAERYFMSDVQARMSGLRNGLYDAWITVARGGPKVKIPFTDVDVTLPTPFNKDYALRSSAKGDAAIAPLSGAALSDVPVRLPFSTTELFRTPDFTNSFLGSTLNGLGYIYSVPFRAIRAADDFVGMTVSRMQLHEEAWHVSQKEYDKLIASGVGHDDALAEVQRIVASFMDERPVSLQASMEKAHKIATASEDFTKETKLNEAYWMIDKMFQHGLVKPLLPFARSITNSFLHTAAATPGWNLVSPKFWDAWNAGGKERDLAISRLAIGGSAGYVFTDMAREGRLTGSGPASVNDRKALEALGWQKYSYIFKPGEISPENKKRLSTLTTLTEGQGDFSGYTFLSYARFNFSPIMAQSADYADAQRFHVGKPDETEWLKATLAIAGSNLNYLQNQPQAAAIGDLVSILSTRVEDGGEKVYDFFRRIGKQYLDVLYTGTPVIGSSNATAIAHIERLNDPLVRSPRIDQMNAPEHIRMFYEQLNRVKSRNPVFSDGLPADLDEIGRRRYVEDNMWETYANFIPIVQARKGKRDPFMETMVSINHGVSRPRDVWNGVSLSVTQYNRYKQLYGQEVKIDPSLFVDTAEGLPMNLEKAVPYLLEKKRQYEQDEGRSFGIGDAQTFVDGVIKKYRRVAKLRMIGFDPSPELAQGEAPDVTELDYEAYGFSDNRVEFPDLAATIDRNKKFYRFYGK